MTRQEPAPAQKQRMSREELNARLKNLDKLSPKEAEETIHEFMLLSEEALKLEREIRGY
jgi:hypothetical protein